MITQGEISRTASRTHKQDRVIEKDYVITWLLLGIADSPLAGVLAFKGGTALKKMYFTNYRFSEDLDFIGPLQGMLGGRDIKIDFTLNEELVLPLSRRDILARFSDCEPLSRQLNVYSLEEILTEKLCALIGRTEPRDLYDAHFLLGLGGLDY